MARDVRWFEVCMKGWRGFMMGWLRSPLKITHMRRVSTMVAVAIYIVRI